VPGKPASEHAASRRVHEATGRDATTKPVLFTLLALNEVKGTERRVHPEFRRLALNQPEPVKCPRRFRYNPPYLTTTSLQSLIGTARPERTTVEITWSKPLWLCAE
jgi:hypothetical protein